MPDAGSRSPAARSGIGDHDILTSSDARPATVRGALVSYVPQDPAVLLNPALRIGTQLREVFEAHGSADSGDSRADRGDDARGRAPRRPRLPEPLPARALRRPAAAGRARDGVREPAPPHRPRRADHRPRRHDAGARAVTVRDSRRCTTSPRSTSATTSRSWRLADRVAVMYAGRVVESAARDELFESAAHPYTRRLVGAIPRLTGGRSASSAFPGTRRRRAAARRLRLRAALHHAHRRVRRGGPTAAPVGPATRRCIRRRRARGAEPRSATRSTCRVRRPDGRPDARRTWSRATARSRCSTRSTCSSSHHECLARRRRVGLGQDDDSHARSPGCTASWTGSIRLGGTELQPPRGRAARSPARRSSTSSRTRTAR